MATTINSGRANSPKLTADVASRAEVFGGRAISFDGISDSIQLNSSIDLGENLTISLWLKPNNGADSFINFGGNKYIWLNNDGTLIWNHSNGTGTRWDTTNNKITMSVWNHLTLVKDGTSGYMYINGLKGADTYTWNSGLSWSGQAFIGAQSATTYHYNGSMADVKFFNTPLTEAQAQELYLKPEQSAPSAVQDNLVLWYPMCEGNPDSPQSIVYDHSKKKLGANIVDSNTENHWGSYGGTVSNTTDGIKIEYGGGSSNGGYVTLQDSKILSQDLEVGATYIFTVDGYYEGGSSGSKLELYAGRQLFTDTFTETRASYEIRFQATSATGDFIRGYGMSASNTIYFENMSLKKVLMGNHAQTKFYGDELVGDPSFDTGGSANITGLASGASVSSGKLVFAHGSGSPNVILKKSSNNILTSGNQYKITFTIANASDDGTYGTDNIARINFSMFSGSDHANYANGTHSVEGTADASTADFNISTASHSFEMTDVSVKQLGVMSSGFATAQEEPTIPQIPLLRYNEKMVFDGLMMNVVWGLVQVLLELATRQLVLGLMHLT